MCTDIVTLHKHHQQPKYFPVSHLVMKLSYHPVSKLLIMLLPAESNTLTVRTCVRFENLLLCIDSYVMNIKNSRNRDLSVSVLLAQGSFSISLCAQ
uniref:Uncharacterized protein n=1 Tax=Arundo donax TaxID=35708 RepID=A0A0A9I295_ARUDO